MINNKRVLLIMFVISLLMPIGLCVYEYKKPVRQIVTVDIEHLIKELTKGIVSSDISPDQIKEVTNKSLNRLDALLAGIAADKKVIIVPKTAVIAGGNDITNEVIDLYGDSYDQ